MSDITEIKVRGYHLDIYAHVNNARYLEFLEEARWSYFEAHEAIGAFADLKLAFVLVNININYRRPAFNAEVLEISTRLAKVGNKSCKVEQVIKLKGADKVIADAEVTFVLMSMVTNKAVSLEGDVKQALDRLVKEEIQ